MSRTRSPPGNWLSSFFGRLVASRRSSPTIIDEEVGRQRRPTRRNGSQYPPSSAGFQPDAQRLYASSSSLTQSPASHASGHSTPAGSATPLSSRSTTPISPHISHKAPGARIPLAPPSATSLAQLPARPAGAIFQHLIPRQPELLTVIVESGLKGPQHLHYIRQLIFQLPDSQGGPGTRRTELAAHSFRVNDFKFDAAATGLLKRTLGQSVKPFDCHYFIVKATLRLQDARWVVHLDHLQARAAVPAMTERLAAAAGFV